MSAAPLVTVAIPTLVAGPPLGACLAALEGQIFRDFEIVIINNGSAPLPVKAGGGIPRREICPGANVGFAAAINLAVRDSASPFIATLNDDTEPEPGWLAALVAESEVDPRTGMCASHIRLFENGRLDSAGMLLCFDGSSKQRGHLKPDGAFPESGEVLCPSACAALYRRAMLEEVGHFDEDFFLYCEDTDLGLRARWLGWRCRYSAAARVRHHYSLTAGSVSVLKARLVERNRLWLALKNFPLILLPVVPFVQIARYFWQWRSVRRQHGAAAAFIRSGNSLVGAVGILFGAHGETLRNLPALLRKRAELRKIRKLGTFEYVRLMSLYRISAREVART